MAKKTLAYALLLEILGIFVAAFSFRWLEPRLLAAAVASGSFVLLGGLILRMLSRLPQKKRLLSFYFAVIHLFGVAIPILALRFMHPHAEFSELTMLGISGDSWHQISEKVYLIYMIATAIDLLREWRREKKASHSSAVTE